MKSYEIELNIGEKVYLSGSEIGMNRFLRRFYYNHINQTPDLLTIIKLTKSKHAYLMDEEGNFYTVPPKNVFKQIIINGK